jgi:hypothetical protein
MWDEILKWLHVRKSLKKKENKTHRNRHNFCGTSSTMKHESSHLGFFLKGFVFKGISHSTKSSHV